MLGCLAAFTGYERWKHATAFREQLPEAKAFLSHPLTSITQAIEVYQLEVARESAEVGKNRNKKVEDVMKRSTYRRAHGLEDENAQGLGAWTARSHAESSRKLDGDEQNSANTGTEIPPLEESGVNKDVPINAYWDGNKPPVKKWLGIW
ncbi:hypothetical protein MMC21_002552 [Puttea exsequens]|nr:hypothetical protein [Puttea exsequens]